MIPNRVNTYEGGIARVAHKGDGPTLNLGASKLTTAGAGTLLAALLATGMLLRTGPAGAYADTVDTGANIDAAFPNLGVGDTFDVFYSCSVAFAATITAAAGITLRTAAANNVIAASTGRLLHFEKTGVATYDLYVI
jgi:hypothetical protein